MIAVIAIFTRGSAVINKIILSGFCLVLGACSTIANMTVKETVKPWEKDILAQDSMQIPADPMHAYTNEHIYFSKEAASGGNGVGGGGCGCN